jgi:WD40 repeat protein
MKRISLGWLVTVIMTAFASIATPALPQDLPSTEPILRIETGMHSGPIWRIGVDAACKMMVTGAQDRTARLWALPDGGSGEPQLLRVLRVPIGNDDRENIAAVAISPDNRLVAAGGHDVNWTQLKDIAVYVFDASSGRLARRLGGLNNSIGHLTFSPDGKFLAATLAGGDRTGGVRVWETTGWRVVGEDSSYEGGGSYGAAFDDADTLYTVAYDGFIRRYGRGFKLDAKAKTLGGPRPSSIAVHPKGDRLAVGYGEGSAIEVYGTKDLQRLFAADTTGVTSGKFSDVAWSKDGARLYAGGTAHNAHNDRLRIWDNEGRGNGRDVFVTQNSVAHLLPCGDWIAVGATDPAIGLISASGEKLVWIDGAQPDMRGKRDENFTISDDGRKVRFGLGIGGDRPVLFDLAESRLIDHAEPTSGLSKPDTESLPVSDWKSSTPKLNGKPIQQLQTYETARSLAIGPAGDRFVLGTAWWLRAYDNGGSEIWKKAATGTVWGVNISRNGKFVVAAYNDGTIRWHRLSDGQEILTLFVHAKTREWVLWTPQGYYTSSLNGDQYVGWHLNRGWEQAADFVTAARLKQHLYRPDIVKRAFELADAAAAVREAGLSGFKLADLASHTPPEFRIVDPGDKIHADKSPFPIRLELGATNDPVTGFDIKVNGRQVTPRGVRNIDQPTRGEVTRALNIPLEKGENHIQVALRNDVGETVQDLLVYLDREGVLNQKGRLFIVAVGVDKYTKLGSRYSLRYAGADARLMMDTLTKKAGPLHTEVISKLLVSDGDIPPTKANIEDALAVFRDARPEDTAILFLASHGVNDGPNYLMIPEDAEFAGGDRWRPSSVVKWSVLQQALQDAQGSRIMFVDTCHSSGAYSSRLVKDAADASIVVFSATDKDTEAQETNDLGHGVFTYAVSQGINGGADFGKRGLVNVLTLGAYVADEVKRMTNDEQEPVFSASGVKNFVVAAP